MYRQDDVFTTFMVIYVATMGTVAIEASRLLQSRTSLIQTPLDQQQVSDFIQIKDKLIVIAIEVKTLKKN